jgi:hypothetical protein
MRKLFALFCFILSTLVFASCGRGGDYSQAVFYAPENIFLNAQTTPDMIFGQFWDNGDFGIVDFSIMADNSVLLLDSINEKIFRLGNGELLETFNVPIDRANYNLFKITADTHGNMYIVSGRAFNAFIKVTPNGELHFSNMESGFSYVDFASTIDFIAIDENIVRITCISNTREVFVRLTFDISGENAVIIDIDYDFNLPEIPYISENHVFGAEVRGTYGNYFILEITEMDDNNVFYHFLALSDADGVLTSRFNLPQGRGVSLKSYNDELYLFVQTRNDIRIINALHLLLSEHNGWQYDYESWVRIPQAAPPDRTDRPPDFTVDGIISNFDIANRTFNLQEAALLTASDERLSEFGINPDDIIFGFYFHKPDVDIQSFRIADNAEFDIIGHDEYGNLSRKEADIETFSYHVQNWMLFRLEIANGEVVSIMELLLP